MKSLVQNLKNGKLEIINSPLPLPNDNEVIIQNSYSLISPGTERMLLEFGNANIINKVRQQPDKVKMVLNKIQTDGLSQTIKSVKNKLDEPISMGYSSVGRVINKGKNVDNISIGDRVISNGPHAEIVKVSKNLCAKVPENISDERAVFTVISSIALQGVRLADPTIGESFVVIGAGLIGQLTSQILLANGCRVLVSDYDNSRLDLIKKPGIDICRLSDSENLHESANRFSKKRGVDGVIITASTSSNEPIASAAQITRKRGRIVLIGTTGLTINRDDFYEKEISFQVSCSYGPGRYDYLYEEKGIDYPYGFVRWTEKRNFEAVLDLMSKERLEVDHLISAKEKFLNIKNIYAELLNDPNKMLGIIIDYEDKIQHDSLIKINESNLFKNSSELTVGFIGAGDYASKTLIPIFKKNKICMHTIVNRSGVQSSIVGKKNNFKFASSNTDDIFNNNDINLVAIASRHDTHAKYIIESLDSNKNIYIEKPFAINNNELDLIKDKIFSLRKSGKKIPHIMIGFNRRFSPHVKKIKELIINRKSSLSITYTINAGKIPLDHWIQDSEIGGGRIIGEVCHFIDLVRFLTGSRIDEIKSISTFNRGEELHDPSSIINIRFVDGSIANINYFTNGSNTFSKEKLEVYCESKILVLDNFRKLKGYGWKNFRSMRTIHQDKGQQNCISEFIDSLRTDTPLIDIDEIFEVTSATIKASDQIKES